MRNRFWAEIDLDAAQHNYQFIKKSLSRRTKLCCVVKANAYGHGAPIMAKLYEELGADWLAVSNIEEAIQLRREGISLPILILGYTAPSCAALLGKHNLSQTVYSYDYAEELNHFAAQESLRLKIHLKLDSGMGRLGFSCRHGKEDSSSLTQALAACRLPSLFPEGVFTHLAVADEGEGGKIYTQEQLSRFQEAVAYLESEGISFAMRHCANSAGILDHPTSHMDMVRAGIILYGALPSSALQASADLRPVMSLHSVVSLVKDLQTGDSVSYGRTFVAPHPMRVATVPVGYADGYRRENGANGACVIIKGKRAPVVGRVCMDQLLVDVTELPSLKRGDAVTVMGQVDGVSVTAEELAERNRTIPYELFCNVGERVPRIYRRDGKTVAIRDNLIPNIT